MIAGAREDSLRGGEIFEGSCEFWKRRWVVDDKVSGDGDEVGPLLGESETEFSNERFVRSRAVVDVGDLGDAKAVERFGPVWEGKLFSSTGELIGLQSGSPDSGWNTDAEDTKGGSTGDATEIGFGALAGHEVGGLAKENV